MKTITAYIITQNEEHIIEYAITNPLLVYDKVLMLDGGSTDRTVSVVKETAEKLNMSHKLSIYSRPFTTLNDQRNYIIQKCETDYLHYIDSDELYKIDHLKKIKEQYINQYSCIQIRSVHFYIDFFHRAVGGDWELSWKMAKVFANLKGRIKYNPYIPKIGDHDLRIDNVDYMSFWKNSIRLCDEDDVVCYHLGHALGREHEHKKIKFFMTYDEPENKKLSNEELDKRAWQSCYFDPRFWIDGINCDPEGIVPFRGEHPDIMKKHPLYGVHVITNDINIPDNTTWRRKK